MTIKQLSKYQFQKIKKFIKEEMSVAFVSRSNGLVYLGIEFFTTEQTYRYCSHHVFHIDSIPKLSTELEARLCSVVKTVA
jgi:hypothetical protein